MSPDFYVGNRSSLAGTLKADVTLLSAHDAMQLKADQSIFRQDANFLYLTGIDEAGWQLVLGRNPYRETLIAPERDEMQVLFEGGLTFAEASATSGVNNVVSAADGQKLIESLSAQHAVCAVVGRDPHEKYNHSTANPSRARLERLAKKLFKETLDARPALNRLRAIKQPEEVVAMRRAIEVSVEGFMFIEKLLREEKVNHEYEIEAELSRTFRATGANGHAYDPIVAFNKNACVLHYSKNESSLAAGGLVLIDAGAAFQGYAADITRTYAVGEVSSRQKAVHAAVERAHVAIIELIKPGLKPADYQVAVDKIMKETLASLGLLKSEADYRKYFPHAVSHGIGIDVHESLGGYGEFLPGMTLTVEPGIYIPEEGIGVRIEDDILVTKTGNEVLSAQLPTSLCYNS